MKVEAGTRKHAIAQNSDFLQAAPTLRRQEWIQQPPRAAIDQAASSFPGWSLSTLDLGF